MVPNLTALLHTPPFTPLPSHPSLHTLPSQVAGGLAFMFETSALLALTPRAAESGAVQKDYAACWEGLPRARIPAAAAESETDGAAA